MAPEQPATFNGKGIEAFSNYVMTNVKYPQEAVTKNYSGKSFVQFIVEKDGKVTEVKIVRSSGYKALDEEAMRVVKSPPMWSPAKDKGQLVKQAFTLPVVFKL